MGLSRHSGPGSTFEKKKTMSSRLQAWKGLNDREILASFFKELNALDLAIGALQANRTETVILSMNACIIGIMPLLLFYLLFSSLII